MHRERKGLLCSFHLPHFYYSCPSYISFKGGICIDLGEYLIKYVDNLGRKQANMLF